MQPGIRLTAWICGVELGGVRRETLMRRKSQITMALIIGKTTLVSILLIATPTAAAGGEELAACTWQGADNGLWSVAGNWSCNVVPNNGGGNTYDVTLGNNTV